MKHPLPANSRLLTLSNPTRAKLVIGQLAASTELLTLAEQVIEQELATIESRSPDIPFDFTNYYSAELGSPLLRRWICLAGLFSPERLIDIKRQTCLIESRLSDEAGRRRVNLDPGVLTLHSLILASHKDHAHRIPLAQGVYVELTLLFRNGCWHPLEWTYPDYRTTICHEWLSGCRKLLKNVI